MIIVHWNKSLFRINVVYLDSHRLLDNLAYPDNRFLAAQLFANRITTFLRDRYPGNHSNTFAPLPTFFQYNTK